MKGSDLPGADFERAKRMARSAAEAVREGKLGYAIIVGLCNALPKVRHLREFFCGLDLPAAGRCRVRSDDDVDSRTGAKHRHPG